MVGFGYDVHRLAEGETLFLGGVLIDSPVGTIAHSDGDVLLHAVCDAILGAAGLGDIGDHFPDTDPQYKNASSRMFVDHAVSMLGERRLKLINIDASIILERPKISPYRQQIRQSIADICGLPFERVNVKATTSEKMGFVGRGEGIEAYCICEVQPQ